MDFDRTTGEVWAAGDGAPGDSAPAETHRLAFTGSGGSLLGIHIVNVFLTLVTFGVYYFWARVRTRRYIVGQTSLDGDHFSYHGRGVEVFLGFLKAGLLFGVPLVALQYLPWFIGVDGALSLIASIAGYVVLLVVMPVARAGARRYRLSRTAWRGVRFGFRGRTADFVKLFVTTSLLTTVTLGLYHPVAITRQHAFLVRHSSFGSRSFDFDGDGRDLLVSFLYAVLLTLPTLGLGWFWFIARKRRFFWDHTTFDGARFHCSITGGPLLWLKVGNLAIIVLTLGLGWPWAAVRNARFVCERLHLAGTVDFAAVTQAARPAAATAEGLLNLLETDFDLG